MTLLDNFVKDLHSSATVLGYGRASVLEHDVPAILVRNVYGQELVWGEFSCNRGKFKGLLSNNAQTEGVTYVPET